MAQNATWYVLTGKDLTVIAFDEDRNNDSKAVAVFVEFTNSGRPRILFNSSILTEKQQEGGGGAELYCHNSAAPSTTTTLSALAEVPAHAVNLSSIGEKCNIQVFLNLDDAIASRG